MIKSLLSPTNLDILVDESEISILQDELHQQPSALVAIPQREILCQQLPLHPHKLDVLNHF